MWIFSKEKFKKSDANEYHVKAYSKLLDKMDGKNVFFKDSKYKYGEMEIKSDEYLIPIFREWCIEQISLLEETNARTI